MNKVPLTDAVSKINLLPSHTLKKIQQWKTRSWKHHILNKPNVSWDIDFVLFIYNPEFEIQSLQLYHLHQAINSNLPLSSKRRMLIIFVLFNLDHISISHNNAKFNKSEHIWCPSTVQALWVQSKYNVDLMTVMTLSGGEKKYAGMKAHQQSPVSQSCRGKTQITVHLKLNIREKLHINSLAQDIHLINLP